MPSNDRRPDRLTRELEQQSLGQEGEVVFPDTNCVCGEPIPCDHHISEHEEVLMLAAILIHYFRHKALGVEENDISELRLNTETTFGRRIHTGHWKSFLRAFDSPKGSVIGDKQIKNNSPRHDWHDQDPRLIYLKRYLEEGWCLYAKPSDHWDWGECQGIVVVAGAYKAFGDGWQQACGAAASWKAPKAPNWRDNVDWAMLDEMYKDYPSGSEDGEEEGEGTEARVDGREHLDSEVDETRTRNGSADATDQLRAVNEVSTHGQGSTEANRDAQHLYESDEQQPAKRRKLNKIRNPSTSRNANPPQKSGSAPQHELPSPHVSKRELEGQQKYCKNCNQLVKLLPKETCCPICCPPEKCKGGKHSLAGSMLVPLYNQRMRLTDKNRLKQLGQYRICEVHGQQYAVRGEVCCHICCDPQQCSREHFGVGWMWEGASL